MLFFRVKIVEKIEKYDKIKHLSTNVRSFFRFVEKLSTTALVYARKNKRIVVEKNGGFMQSTHTAEMDGNAQSGVGKDFRFQSMKARVFVFL